VCGGTYLLTYLGEAFTHTHASVYHVLKRDVKLQLTNSVYQTV